MPVLLQVIVSYLLVVSGRPSLLKEVWGGVDPSRKGRVGEESEGREG